MKEKEQIYKTLTQVCIIVAQGLSYEFSKFRDDFTPFFDFERP